MPVGHDAEAFRIAAFSGYTGDKWCVVRAQADGRNALKEQAEGSGCEVLFGDYLAEMVCSL